MIALDREIVLCPVDAAGYDQPLPDQGQPFPELPAHAPRTAALAALRQLWRMAELDIDRFGQADWNPAGELVRSGERVVIKPNWVLHENRSGGGLDPLLTHVSLIEAVVHYVAKARPAQIVIGDAPLQGCDFGSLQRQIGMGAVLERLARSCGPGCALLVRDFRGVIREESGIIPKQVQIAPDRDRFVLFDLGDLSALEPISVPNGEFRVTMYNPDLLGREHGPRRHRYAIARDVMEADVVFSLPKLKTHKKAGMTGALKNMVGINCHKEYLPHHRKGSAASGGDCYQDRALLSSAAETALDLVYRHNVPVIRHVVERTIAVYNRLLRMRGRTLNLEGAWFGNDTIWRTCHDLIHILHHGRADGTLAAEPNRRVVTITDAIVAGEGDGPLRPKPVPLGLVTLGTAEAALDWIHSLLMGLDPARIPIVARAFDGPMRLARAAPEELSVVTPRGRMRPRDAAAMYGRRFEPPAGWRGACELGDVPPGGRTTAGSLHAEQPRFE